VVDRLAQHELLGERTIVAHAVHVDARETEILAESGTWVTHQPRSNMNNGVGVADVESILRAGAPVCLGTDGFSHTMWAEWKAAYLMHKLWHRDPRRMNGMDVVRMGVHNNARLAKELAPDKADYALLPLNLHRAQFFEVPFEWPEAHRFVNGHRHRHFGRGDQVH